MSARLSADDLAKDPLSLEPESLDECNKTAHPNYPFTDSRHTISMSDRARTATSFLDLPGEIRNLIYRDAHPGHLVDIAEIPRVVANLTSMRGGVGAEYMAYHCEHSVFLMDVEHIPTGDRVPLWRRFLNSISHIDARRLRHLIFDFDNFELKVDIAPRNLPGKRLAFEYTANYGDDYDSTWSHCPGMDGMITVLAKKW